MSIFDKIDKFSQNYINENELVQYIKEHPSQLWQVQNDMSVYAYASLISPKCLQIIHEQYLEISSDTDTNSSLKPWEVSGSNGYRAIHYVAESNLSKQLLYLINIVGVDVNATNIDGDTALHIICYHNYTNIINILLYAGNPYIDIINKNYYTPLSICVKNRNLQLIYILLKLNPLLVYTKDDMTFNIMENVKASKDKEMIHLFEKFERRKRVKRRNIEKKKRISVNKKRLVQQYHFYCDSLSDLGYKSIIHLARSIGINYSRSDYPETFTITDIKNMLCQKISKNLLSDVLHGYIN
jgi:hypothetical protein